MPRALVVTSSFLPGRGGIESYLAELCDELRPHLAVLAPATREGRGIPDLPYDAHGSNKNMLVPHRGLVPEIARHARSLGTDRVLFGTPWPLSLLGPRLRAAGLSYAAIVHGAEMLVPSRTPVVRARFARALAGADLLLPVSEFTQERTREFLSSAGLPCPEFAVLRARVDLDRFTPHAAQADTRAAFGLAEDDRMILCFGRLVKRKGVDRVIEAMGAITARVPKAVLVVGGTGPELNRLKRLAARRPGRVVFLGRVPDEDAPALFAAADLFALPVADRWFGLEIEGLGVVLLEAAACGTPCVTGISGGTPEAVIDGETGYVIDATDRGKLVTSLATLLEDRERATTMGVNGRKFVQREFAARRLPNSFLDWLGLERSWTPSKSHAKED
jgi:phosphatidyl-myo-inositol dimannoside synthase